MTTNSIYGRARNPVSKRTSSSPRTTFQSIAKGKGRRCFIKTECALQEAGMRTAKLDEIVRQKDPALKSAVEMLATGQVSAALDALQQQGHVKEIPNREERVRAVA